MIELGLVDLSADGRRRLSTLVEKWSWAPPDARVSVPRLSLHLLSPEEVRFHGNLDVCIIGPDDLSSPFDEIRFELDEVFIKLFDGAPLQEICALTGIIKISILMLAFYYFFIVLKNIECQFPPMLFIEHQG